MTTFLWVCLLLGGGVVVLQFGASLLGLDHGEPHGDFGHGPISEGLQLLSLRALSAGVAFFGLAGLAILRLGLPSALAVVGGAIAGGAATVGVSFVMRSMQRLESDRTFRLATAVGQSGEVYLSIPGQRSGVGKIHITLQERFMELEAITPDGELPSGTRVLVIDTVAPHTVIVVPQPPILDEGEGDA